MNGKQIGTYKELGIAAFSPDGSRYIAFAEKNDGTYAIILDGSEIQTTKYSLLFDQAFFSPDSKRYAFYLLQSANNTVNTQLFVDNKTQSVSKGRIANFAFSKDSSQFVYSVDLDDQNSGVYVSGSLVDKEATTSAVTDLQFIGNTHKIAYILSDRPPSNNPALIKISARVVIDGKREKDYYYVGKLKFNKDGSKYMYIAENVATQEEFAKYKNASSNSLVMNGQEIAKNVPYADFSPDGNHFVYWSSEKPMSYIEPTSFQKGYSMYLDGKKIENSQDYFTYSQHVAGLFTNVEVGNYVWFSDDSKQLRFLTRKGDEVFLNIVTIP